jgi:hypothetical protein
VKRPRLEAVDDSNKTYKSPLGERKSIPEKNGTRMEHNGVQNGTQNGVQNGVQHSNGKTTTLADWKKAHELEKEFPVVRDSKQALRYHNLFEVSVSWITYSHLCTHFRSIIHSTESATTN